MNIEIIDAIRENDLEKYLEFADFNDTICMQLHLNVALVYASEDIIDCIYEQTSKYHEEFQSETIIHNGFEYKTIYSSATGKVWLDRNLGATRVATSFYDEAATGDYYQWGRMCDGHQHKDSDISCELIPQTTSNKNFITSSAECNYSWTCSDLEELWINNVCPVGFRLPTAKELQSELIALHIKNNTEAFTSFLKLTSGGYKEYYDGVIKDRVCGGSLWTSSFKHKLPQAVYYYENGIGDFESYYANGHNIRCIKL